MDPQDLRDKRQPSRPRIVPGMWQCSKTNNATMRRVALIDTNEDAVARSARG